MSGQLAHLTAVVFDWAGTTVDHGSLAPAIVFQEVFRRHGVNITLAHVREPMGMAKREHIAAIAAMPEVATLGGLRKGVRSKYLILMRSMRSFFHCSNTYSLTTRRSSVACLRRWQRAARWD